MEYLHWKEIKIEDFSSENIENLYNEGFVFTRIDKGVMHQTRSVRIDLNKFELTSENRRILRKGENIEMKELQIPHSSYTWEIGKMAKDFYDKKTDHAFSANKIKELITSADNFNLLLSYSTKTDSTSTEIEKIKEESKNLGNTICYRTGSILHYCYPFYNLDLAPKDMGMIMMTKAIITAKEKGLRYVYLGSLQRPSDVYKLQLSGIEWFDGETKKWSGDTEKVKEILKK